MERVSHSIWAAHRGWPQARIGYAFMEDARARGLRVDAEEYETRGAAMQLIEVENTRSDGVTA